MNKLSVILKKIRESRNITQLELARMANIGTGTIGDIESGKNKARISTLEKIAKALDLSSKEREELFSATLPTDVNAKLSKKERIQKEDFMNQATLLFNDESISEEDKQKMFDSLQEVFVMAKILNKKKS